MLALRSPKRPDLTSIENVGFKNSRYNDGTINLFLSVLAGSLQGIAERPLPCDYYVIQQIGALSRDAIEGGSAGPNCGRNHA